MAKSAARTTFIWEMSAKTDYSGNVGSAPRKGKRREDFAADGHLSSRSWIPPVVYTVRCATA